MILFMHELKQNLRTLMIWSLSVGLICYGCILLYKSVEHQLKDMAQLYSNMGEMTKVLGLDKVSLATLDGYFATEIVIMFGLGAGMFAAMMGASSLSKEEEGHTSEFLHTLPFGRLNILIWKYFSLLFMLLIFNGMVVGLEVLGIWQIGLDFSYDLLLSYQLLALLMQVEVVSLAFLLSALSRKKQIGLSFGLVLLLYVMDMMSRIVPDIEFLKYLTPYYFANGADVFSKVAIQPAYLAVAFAVIVISLILGSVYYQRKDLSA